MLAWSICTVWPASPTARMPSCPLPLIVVPEIKSGWNALEVTPARSILIPWAPLLVRAARVIGTGERVLTPSAAVLVMLVVVRVRFCAERFTVGVPIEIPVAAYRTAELVSTLAFPASRTRPPQSPAVVAGQRPEALGTKTEPPLRTRSGIALQ